VIKSERVVATEGVSKMTKTSKLKKDRQVEA
jgi:hypothetical protein